MAIVHKTIINISACIFIVLVASYAYAADATLSDDESRVTFGYISDNILFNSPLFIGLSFIYIYAGMNFLLNDEKRNALIMFALGLLGLGAKVLIYSLSLWLAISLVVGGILLAIVMKLIPGVRDNMDEQAVAAISGTQNTEDQSTVLPYISGGTKRQIRLD